MLITNHPLGVQWRALCGGRAHAYTHMNTHAHAHARTLLAGKRAVFFESNGVPRVVEVVDTRTHTHAHSFQASVKCSLSPTVCHVWWRW